MTEAGDCLRRFGRPDKQMRSICRADKMYRNSGVGMFTNEVGARSEMT
jgi:hypothetical protein